jgi:hypothetical protein
MELGTELSVSTLATSVMSVIIFMLNVTFLKYLPPPSFLEHTVYFYIILKSTFKLHEFYDLKYILYL